MTIRLHHHHACATIAILGRFDFHAHSEFRRNSDEALRLPGVRTIEVALDQVGYLDSSALGMLLLLREKAQNVQRTIILAGAAGLVRQVLEVANFGRLFEIR